MSGLAFFSSGIVSADALLSEGRGPQVWPTDAPHPAPTPCHTTPPTPLARSWVVNLASPIVGVPFPIFVLALVVGHLPINFISVKVPALLLRYCVAAVLLRCCCGGCCWGSFGSWSGGQRSCAVPCRAVLCWMPVRVWPMDDQTACIPPYPPRPTPQPLFVCRRGTT